METVMPRGKIVVAALFGFALSASAADTNPAVATNYPAVFQAVWSAVDENFYDPTFHGVNWPAVRVRYAARLSGAHDDREFLLLMDAMLAELKVSHVHLAPPQASTAHQVGIGVDIKSVDGAPTIVGIPPLSSAAMMGLRIGDRIEGSPTDLTGIVGSRVTVSVLGCDGIEQTREVVHVAQLFPHEHPGWRWSRMSWGPGHTLGYIRIDRFDDGAADLADQAMDELKDTDGLVIDVRANSGGNVTALRLAGYFMPPGEAPAVALFARPYLKALGRTPTASDVERGPKVEGAYTDAAVFKAVNDHQGQAVFYTEALGGRRYQHPVVVLISEDTASAAEGFAWAMRLRSHAKFIGRRTAGELLSAADFPVGDGWTLTIPVQGLWGPDGRDLADQSLSPDIATSWTRTDVCAGRDPDLQRALAVLKDGP
jgi:carboxyl-terminal processing protease